MTGSSSAGSGSAGSGSAGSSRAERLPRLTPADLTAEQAEVYRSITQGPRAQGKQLFPLTDADGALTGPFGVMLHAPALGVALQEVGAAIRYRTDLSDRAREIAILVVAVAMGSEFEWFAHSRVGAAVGLTPDELAALQKSRFRSDDPVEEAVAALSAALLDGRAVGDEEYARYDAVLGARAIVEVVVLVGYYRLLAQSMQVFEIGVPEEQT